MCKKSALHKWLREGVGFIEGAGKCAGKCFKWGNYLCETALPEKGVCIEEQCKECHLVISNSDSF